MNKAWFLLLFFAIIACQQNNGSESTSESKMETVKADDGTEGYTFSSEDATMNTAIKQANKTWPLFEQNIFAGHPGTGHFAVKMIFTSLGDEEHLWLVKLHKKDGHLYGVLFDPPYKINNLYVGDTMLINKDRISDWVYSEDGKMVGGYTIRVIYNNMNAEEKKEYQASLPYKIE